MVPAVEILLTPCITNLKHYVTTSTDVTKALITKFLHMQQAVSTELRFKIYVYVQIGNSLPGEPTQKADTSVGLVSPFC